MRPQFTGRTSKGLGPLCGAAFVCSRMPCFGPLTAYYAKDVNPTGRRSLVFDKRKSHSGVELQVPCGKCIGCRLDYNREWAIRCMHEKRLHSASAFITLTYDDRSLPRHGSLARRDVVLFMKRLRKVRPAGLRFFGCGEYGGETQRPHYHVLLFNTDFPDMRFYKDSKSGESLYVSKELQRLWSLDGKEIGHCDIGSVTASSCSYVAGYVLKKVGPPKDYGLREPEFVCRSNRPGLGYGWYLKYRDEAYKHDSVVMNSFETGIPRYYDRKFESVDSKRLAKLKRLRRAKALLQSADSSSARLRVRELVATAKAKLFARDL